jgi:hypothetical protein
MTLKETKQQLAHLLADEDNKVIALSGKWGTGKSFMWEEVKALAEPAVKGALYASIFGATSIDQIKLKLIQSAAKSMEEYPILFKGLRQAWNSSVKVAEGFHKGFTALNDIGLLLAPAVLRGKVLVLDDIERKHEKLSVDEILGFIDEMTKRHNCRVLVILNDDKLDQRDLWDTLREKVVDQELRLSTSALEAVEIALDSEKTQWAEAITANIQECGVTNIRIAKKIIKVVNRILGNHPDLAAAVLDRTLPSIVFLAAIHYKGLDDAPDFAFVLDQGTKNDWGVFLALNKEPKTEADERKSRWKALMQRMGIYACDEFELLVVEYLKSGLFDTQELAKVINRYAMETELLEADALCNKFFKRSFWEHRLTEEQLLEEGREVAAGAARLSPTSVTALCDELNKLPGGEAVANEAIQRWLVGFRARRPEETPSEVDFYGRKMHPQIQAEFDALERNTQANISAIDACEYISKNSGWGDRQTLALKSTSASDFEMLIRTLDTKRLKILLWKMTELTANKRNYEILFGSAMDNFVEACRSIVQTADHPRLSTLLRALFDEKNISDLLELQAPQLDAAIPSEG